MFLPDYDDLLMGWKSSVWDKQNLKDLFDPIKSPKAGKIVNNFSLFSDDSLKVLLKMCNSTRLKALEEPELIGYLKNDDPKQVFRSFTKHHNLLLISLSFRPKGILN